MWNEGACEVIGLALRDPRLMWCSRVEDGGNSAEFLVVACIAG